MDPSSKNDPIVSALRVLAATQNWNGCCLYGVNDDQTEIIEASIAGDQRTDMLLGGARDALLEMENKIFIGAREVVIDNLGKPEACIDLKQAPPDDVSAFCFNLTKALNAKGFVIVVMAKDRTYTLAYGAKSTNDQTRVLKKAIDGALAPFVVPGSITIRVQAPFFKEDPPSATKTEG